MKPKTRRVQVEMPISLVRRLKHAAVDTDSSVSELIRRGAHIAAAYVAEHHHELPPARAGLARRFARTLKAGADDASTKAETNDSSGE